MTARGGTVMGDLFWLLEAQMRRKKRLSALSHGVPMTGG